MATDINRGTNGVNLPLELSQEVWEKARQSSAVMQLANKMPLSGSGVSVPLITGDPIADFVDETGLKKISNSTVSNKEIRPYKIAVIQTFSNEFKRDMNALYEAIVARMPGAIGARFDQEVFHGTTVRTGMDRLSLAQDLVLDSTNTYGDLVAIDNAVATANGTVTGWALSPKARGALLTATDTTGRPMYYGNLQNGSLSTLLDAPLVVTPNVYKADAAGDDGEVIGFAGDWSAAYYGVVEDINIKVTEEAALKNGSDTIFLFQQNMFAVLAEIEVGFAVKDIDKFVKITSGVNSVA